MQKRDDLFNQPSWITNLTLPNQQQTYFSHLNCRLGNLLFLKSSSSLERPCGPLSNVLATVVRDEFNLVKIELVDPNMALADRPAATEFLYFASAPGAADSTLDVTSPPNCKGAVGGGVEEPIKGLGLLPSV